MPVVHMGDLVAHAYRNGYAVGAFEIADLDALGGVIRAAERCRAPAILALRSGMTEASDTHALMAAVEQAARACAVPVAVQAMDADGPEQAAMLIGAGCNGLSVATTATAFEHWIAGSRRVADLARKCGVAVEGPAEAPPTAGRDPSHGVPAQPAVEEIKAFAERAGIDVVRIGVDRRGETPGGRLKPDYRRIGRISEAVCRPLAVEVDPRLGEDQMRRLIGYGVSKVNCGPALTDRALGRVWSALMDRPPDAAALRETLREAVEAEAAHCMHVWGAAGRAAEVQIQCAPWEPVEHLLPCRVADGTPREEAMRVLLAGRDTLLRVTGVRDVLIGAGGLDGTPGPYCWLVRAVHPAVIGQLRVHPLSRGICADEAAAPQARGQHVRGRSPGPSPLALERAGQTARHRHTA
ncbi:MAG: class II fructose-bisphosphate aldolase [Chromatiales bacterium]|jgi:fructose-bisphosphate aldolase class II